MDRKALLNDIRTKNIKPVYLFCGDDEYSKRDALDRIKKALLADGFEDLDFYSADDADADRVADACRTLPFMSEKRVVVIRNYKTFTARSKSSGDDNNDESEPANKKA